MDEEARGQRAGDRIPSGSYPAEFLLFLKLLAGAVLLSILDALIRWPLQGAKTAFGTLFFKDPLSDINCYWPRFTSLHTPVFFLPGGTTWMYPAPCAFLYELIYGVSTFRTFHEVYLCLSIGLLAIVAALFGYQLRRAGLAWMKALAFTLVLTVVSWPIYFCLERGNLESILWLMLAVALALFVQERWYAAAIAIGFVAAFKIYPILFLALFLSLRRYREVGTVLLSAAVTSVAGLFYLDRNLSHAARFTAQGIDAFLATYSARYLIDANGYDHSAFALLKLLLRSHPQLIPHAVSLYTLTAGLLATWYYFARIRHAPRFNQLLAICTLMVLLPATSFDYTLQAMYIPFAWLCLMTVSARRMGKVLPGTAAFFTAFALLFSPLVFVRGLEYTVGGQVRAVVLLSLLYLAARFPIPDPSKADGASAPPAQFAAEAPGARLFA